MPGEVYAIICAFLWALSSTIVKSQVHKVPIVLLNVVRTVPAVLIYWGSYWQRGGSASLLRFLFGLGSFWQDRR